MSGCWFCVLWLGLLESEGEALCATVTLPSALAAIQSAAPMLRSMTVADGCSRPASMPLFLTKCTACMQGRQTHVQVCQINELEGSTDQRDPGKCVQSQTAAVACDVCGSPLGRCDACQCAPRITVQINSIAWQILSHA